MTTRKEQTLVCDFCDKSQNQVQTVIAGLRDTHICDECVMLGLELIVYTSGPPWAGADPESAAAMEKGPMPEEKSKEKSPGARASKLSDVELLEALMRIGRIRHAAHDRSIIAETVARFSSHRTVIEKALHQLREAIFDYKRCSCDRPNSCKACRPFIEVEKTLTESK